MGNEVLSVNQFSIARLHAINGLKLEDYTHPPTDSMDTPSNSPAFFPVYVVQNATTGKYEFASPVDATRRGHLFINAVAYSRQFERILNNYLRTHPEFASDPIDTSIVVELFCHSLANLTDLQMKCHQPATTHT